MIATRMGRTAIGLSLPAVLVVAWWFASAGSTSPYVPPLATILDAFRETWLFAHVGSDVVPSLFRLFAGYFLAVVIGIALGVLLGRNRRLDSAFQPTIQFIRAIPGVGLVPLSIVLLKTSDNCSGSLGASASWRSRCRPRHRRSSPACEPRSRWPSS